MMKFKNKKIVKYICSNCLLTIDINFPIKSMFEICEKLYATSHTFNRATNLLRLYITLNTYFK